MMTITQISDTYDIKRRVVKDAVRNSGLPFFMNGGIIVVPRGTVEAIDFIENQCLDAKRASAYCGIGISTFNRHLRAGVVSFVSYPNDSRRKWYPKEACRMFDERRAELNNALRATREAFEAIDYREIDVPALLVVSRIKGDNNDGTTI